MTKASINAYAKKFSRYFTAFFKWVFLSCITGIAGGAAGTFFRSCIMYVTGIRSANGWIVYFLPLGGLLIVFLYRACKINEPHGTNLILSAIRSPEPIPLIMAPLIFLSTVLTHLFGGSAGREGAALQLGGSLGFSIGRLFRLDEKDLHIITMSGMAACFSALFGTPMTSTIFVMEVVTVGVMYYAALVPCALSAIVAAGVAKHFESPVTAYTIENIPSIDILPLLRVAALAVLCAFVSVIFCTAMSKAGQYYKKFFPNQYARAAAGGALLVLLSLVFGRDYLGMGGGIIDASMNGSARPEAFILKILFTAVTLEAGFRGGEIVPAFFVGSTFGCFMGGILGISPSFGASIGFMSVFCGVTNCPLTAFVLSLEVFGAKGAVYYLLAAGISYMLSGYSGIYSEQKILYAKDKPLFIGNGPHG